MRTAPSGQQVYSKRGVLLRYVPQVMIITLPSMMRMVMRKMMMMMAIVQGPMSVMRLKDKVMMVKVVMITLPGLMMTAMMKMMMAMMMMMMHL